MPGNNTTNNNDKPKNKKLRIIVGLVTWCIFILGGLAILLPQANESPEDLNKTYNEFVAYVEEGKVELVKYDSSNQEFFFKLKEDETEYTSTNPRDPNFKKTLLEADVEVEEIEVKDGFLSIVGNMLFMIAQYAILMGMFLFVFKKIQGGSEEVEIQTGSTKKFSDVAGLEEVKESLMTTVDMLKNPKKYLATGAHIPKGALLYGPPGTGKTLLAKAIAGEAGVNFLATNGADFDNKYVGVGADKVRKLFKEAKKVAPCILFIDELDAVGTKRSGGEKSYERQTLNQLLSCMDGFDITDGVFVFAATNDVESLDPALLRPGRFDARYAVPLPDTAKDRLAIIKLYIRNKKLDQNVSLNALSKQTMGCSPAMIEALLNEAAIESVKNGGIITQKNIDDAFYRQIMDGHKKKNNDRDVSEHKLVAYHEAGHAVVGYYNDQEVSKISIVPTTSGAGGVTIFNPKKMGLYTKEELMAKVRMMYAGRNAEVIINGKEGVTTGASNDIKEATLYIREMVTSYGMSEYGLLNLDVLSVDTTDILDECKTISTRLEVESMACLHEHREVLDYLAAQLIEKETLEENEIIEIFKNFEAKETKEESKELLN